MSADQKSRPSFSSAGRWRIGFDKVLRVLLVLAVMGMLNYLGGRYYHRFHWSSQTQTALSPRTLAVVHSLTNQVNVILYYDRSADFYPDVLALLNEYRAANKNISVRTVDYERDPGAAQMVKEKYEQYFNYASDTNLVIFDCGGRVKVLPGDKLSTYESKAVGWVANPDDPQKRELEFERRPVSFNGELAFTSILLALANPEPIKAYFLQGQGEVSLTDTHQQGFQKFATVLEQNFIQLENLDWIQGGGVPADCNLLIIAAPDRTFDPSQIDQIAQYLRDGGRLLVFFGANSQGHPTGLEDLLKKWGVGVMDDIAQDWNYTTSTLGYDMAISQFGKHPIVSSLTGMELQVYTPRPILDLYGNSPPANAPEVDVLFGTTAQGTLLVDKNEPPHNYPLACAVEQKPVAGVTNPRGNTRIVVVGDATFVGNLMIDAGGNRDFLESAVNWLSDRPLLLTGIGPRPVTNFRLHISQHQQRQLDWLLLGALPGIVLILGWFVWLVRRR